MGKLSSRWRIGLKRLWRYTKFLVLLGVMLVLGLLSPVLYVETICQGSGEPKPYDSLIASEFHRPEARTLMTYPEWNIVHAYEDYAEVIAKRDPHEFGFVRAVVGFWSSLCSLSMASSSYGNIDGPTKQMVYVIGVSFTAELLLKAAYEETLGRLFTAIRGNKRAPLDELSASHAKNYAKFLQQVPWYKWRFREDHAELREKATKAWRDTERRLALGIEYSMKASYADVIAEAVSQAGQDELTLRMIIRNVDLTFMEEFDQVNVLSVRPEGIEIETTRYRALTHLLQNWANAGADFVEISGNDDILITVLSQQPSIEGANYSILRQGFDDYRHLVVIKVADLADSLRTLQASRQRLEHIYDY